MSSEVLRAALQTAQRARARMIERLREQGIRDERVLAAMMAVPRQLFVEEALASRAYEDTALPLGLQQTISQPFVVARMIEILRAGRELGKTLEVGTGCGYQAAVLSQVATEVYSVERLRPLLDLLPIAGGSGTLSDRFIDTGTRASAGWLRAKTGSLTGTNTLAGVVTDRSGRVLTFGDMPNDIAMLTWAGHGVAMGNAHPGVRPPPTRSPPPTVRTDWPWCWSGSSGSSARRELTRARRRVRCRG